MRLAPLAGCAVAGVMLLGGCTSGASDGGGKPSALAPSVTSIPPESPPGTGVVVIGGAPSTFTVDSCRLEPDPAEPELARALVVMKGSGTTKAGVDFTIELQRFSTGADVVTYTDTMTYSDSGRILQAQRIEVGGQVTDLRDAKAATALLRTRAGGVRASALASAPGERAKDGGLIGLALDATC